jgi:GLPGLI family protein
MQFGTYYFAYHLKRTVMTKVIFKLAQALIILGLQLLSGQNFTGQAIYETKSKAPQPIGGREMSPEMQKQIEEQMKRQLEKTFVLNFNQFESSWEQEQKLETPQPALSGVNIKFIDSGDSKRYNNLRMTTTLSEEEIFGKEFLVSDDLPKWNWTMTDESKKIGNYTCYKATALLKVTDQERAQYEKRKLEMDKNPKRILIIDEPQDYAVTAWYTPDIPVGHGPEGFWGLPGLILETSDGQRTTLCSKIILNPKEKITIDIPKTGEKVTRKTFDEIREKKLKEMQDMPRGRGRDGERVIRIGG